MISNKIEPYNFMTSVQGRKGRAGYRQSVAKKDMDTIIRNSLIPKYIVWSSLFSIKIIRAISKQPTNSKVNRPYLICLPFPVYSVLVSCQKTVERIQITHNLSNETLNTRGHQIYCQKNSGVALSTLQLCKQSLTQPVGGDMHKLTALLFDLQDFKSYSSVWFGFVHLF